MLPALLYNIMERNPNELNSSSPSGFSFAYDNSVIRNYVRNRKKNTELPNCPVCSCTIRSGELEAHLGLEVDRLNKLSSSSSKRKLSNTSISSTSNNLAMPGSSSGDTPDEAVDMSGCTGSETYQRIHSNRLQRLRARARRMSPVPTTGECPVCNAKLPTPKLQRHALRCLRRTGAIVDEEVPDTSSEDGSIDVENDDASAGGSFGAVYEWCGQLRVRAAALQDSEARIATPVRRASVDTALVVDGDEDTELYGPPQYSPSRIAPNSDVETEENQEGPGQRENADQPSDDSVRQNGIVEASAETRILALKVRIKELESKQNYGTEMKCLICLGPYTSPTVSIQCWHVYCEVCWLDSLRSKKICPQCNAITSSQHLRRIYM